MHALETWWRTQKLNRDFCFRKAGVLDPGTQPLVSRIRVLLHEVLAATSSVLGEHGLPFLEALEIYNLIVHSGLSKASKESALRIFYRLKRQAAS